LNSNAAIWSRLNILAAIERSLGRDTDLARDKVFKAVVEAAINSHFRAEYGERYLLLHNLGTHPEYERRGAASALVQWGLGLADREGLPIGLFATEAGLRLYLNMGFKVLGETVFQVDGDPMTLVLKAMLRLPKVLV